MTIISKKMCMVGDFGVGKTSLIRRFVERQFSDQYLSTVGVKISRKTIELTEVEKPEAEKRNIQLLIWDLEGHTKFKAIAPSYLQGASGALVVADVTRHETIERISEHLQLFSSVNPKGVIIIALNKVDLVEPEKVEKLLEITQFPEYERVFKIYTTSAKNGTFVDEMFHTLSAKMLEPI